MIAMVIETSTISKLSMLEKPSYSLNGLDEVDTTQNFTYIQVSRCKTIYFGNVAAFLRLIAVNSNEQR